MKKIIILASFLLSAVAQAAVPITNNPQYPGWLVDLSHWLFG